MIIAAADLYETRLASRAYRRAGRRLDRRLTGLNEAALLTDGLLAGHAEVAHEIHARLFDTELTVQNIGRLSEVLFEAERPVALHQAIANCLADVRAEGGELEPAHLAALLAWSRHPAAATIGALDAGRVARLCAALVDWHVTLARWQAELVPARQAMPFESPVTLMLGNLPGSLLVSASAATPEGSRRARLGLDSFVQAGIRIAVAVAVAAALGSIVSERRFYWAVIAVFIAFIGANTTGEQVAKAANRVFGTVIGIFFGSLLAHAVGLSTWSVLVIVAALGIGVYFIRVSYVLMVIGVTVVVSQLYVQLGEYSSSLLVLRLEETAIGAGVAVLAALLVFPVRTLQAARVATREYYAKLGGLIDELAAQLTDERAPIAMTTAIRGLDHASQQLLMTVRPLAHSPFRRDVVQSNQLLYRQASFHARNLTAVIQREVKLPPATRALALDALGTQRELVGALEASLSRLASNKQYGASTTRLTEALRRTGDVIPVSFGHAGVSTDQRLLLRHVVRLGDALAELGESFSTRHADTMPAR